MTSPKLFSDGVWAYLLDPATDQKQPGDEWRLKGSNHDWWSVNDDPSFSYDCEYRRRTTNPEAGPMENLLDGLDKSTDALSTAELNEELKARGIDPEKVTAMAESVRAEASPEPSGEEWTVNDAICYNCGVIQHDQLDAICMTCQQRALEVIPKKLRNAHNTALHRARAGTEQGRFDEAPGIYKALCKVIDFADWGWSIIANAGGGDWEKESKDWQEAAAKYRDQFHNEIRFLAGVPQSETATPAEGGSKA